MNRVRCSFFALLILLCATVDAAAAQPSALPELVAEALANNPELRGAEVRWRMYQRKIVSARSLGDPTLTFAFSSYPVDSFDADQIAMTGNDLSLAQKFPFPGKLGLKGEVAEAQAAWYRRIYEDAQLSVRRGVKDAWYRLASVDQIIAVTDQNQQLLKDIILLAESRYEVGKGLQQDVFKAQLEHSRLLDQLLVLRQQREVALADLNTLLGRPSTTPLAGLPAAEPIPLEASLMELQAAAENNRPLFGAYRALIDQYAAQEQLARLDYRPDFTVFAGYRFRDDGLADGGTDFASAGVTVNLPIFRQKRSEALAEAQAGSRMARHQYDDARAKVHANLHRAFADLERSRNQVQLYQTGLVPQASQSLQAALSAYAVGKVDFLNVLNSVLGLNRNQIDELRAVADYQRSLAWIEAEAGLDPVTVRTAQ